MADVLGKDLEGCVDIITGENFVSQAVVESLWGFEEHCCNDFWHYCGPYFSKVLPDANTLKNPGLLTMDYTFLCEVEGI